MEDAARKLHSDYSGSNCPSWIIGAPDVDDWEKAQHLTMKVWPEREEAAYIHPDIMNQLLCDLSETHC